VPHCGPPPEGYSGRLDQGRPIFASGTSHAAKWEVVNQAHRYRIHASSHSQNAATLTSIRYMMLTIAR
jgi:hypothetical protein